MVGDVGASLAGAHNDRAGVAAANDGGGQAMNKITRTIYRACKFVYLRLGYYVN
jgi:hypothetical protein